MTPASIALARESKRAVLARVGTLELQLKSMQQIFVRMMERANLQAMVLSEQEIDVDPARLVIIEVPAKHTWIVGIKETGDTPFELSAVPLEHRPENANHEPG